MLYKLYDILDKLICGKWSITGIFAVFDAEITIGPAEALQRSMLDLMQDNETMYARPMFWAPFMVVGEGNSEFSVHQVSILSVRAQRALVSILVREPLRSGHMGHFIIP